MTRDERAHAFAVVMVQEAEGYIAPEVLADRAYAFVDAMDERANRVTVNAENPEGWERWTAADAAARPEGPYLPSVVVDVKKKNGDIYHGQQVGQLFWGRGTAVAKFRRV